MKNLYYPSEIMDSKFENNKLFYLVKWKNYTNPTWEPSKNIEHLKELLESYYTLKSFNNIGLKPTGYIYGRVSSKKQSEYSNGHTSLEIQEQQCLAFATGKDIKIVDCVKEARSGKDMNKLDGLNYLINIASKGQTIFIYDISRFSRNIKQALNILDKLSDKGVNIYSISEKITYTDLGSRNQFRIQLCAANYVSEVCSAKVKASIEFRRKRGDHIGPAPFGFKTIVDKKTHIRKLIKNPKEMKIITLIRTQKTTDPVIILKTLNKHKIKFRNKNPTERSIKRIIKKFNIKER